MKSTCKRASFYIADILEKNNEIESTVMSAESSITNNPFYHFDQTEQNFNTATLLNPFSMLKFPPASGSLFARKPCLSHYEEQPNVVGLEEKPSALNALIQMTTSKLNQNFTSSSADQCQIHPKLLHLYAKNEPSFKKRRKSRTAFTNQQIVELERRFSQQKYLAQGDRDQIAQLLNLTNSQVITWFQNRRAKLKRELEERKNDLLATERINKLTDSNNHSNSHLLFLNQSNSSQLPMDVTTSGNYKSPSGHSTDISTPRFFYRSDFSPPISTVSTEDTNQSAKLSS